MAVAAQRFKFLDNETNVPIPDLKQLIDNAVYNVGENIPSEFPTLSTEELDKLNSSLSELAEKGLEEMDLESIVNKAISSFSNLELPDFVNDALDFLKDLDFSSLKGFFKDVLDVGMYFLCNNLDFLKLFLLGFSLSGNVLAGLLLAYLLSLLDRICDSYLSKDRRAHSNNKEIFDSIIPIKNNIKNDDIAYSSFKQYMADYEYINTLSQGISTAFNPTNFLSSVVNGTKETISNVINSLSNNEGFLNNKKSLLSTIDTNLNSYTPGSREYNNLLYTRGQIYRTPPISNNRSLMNIVKDNLSLNMGKLAKALPNITINPIKQLGLEGVEKDLFDKFINFRQTTITERDIFKSRDLRSDSFININFSGLIPSLTSEIKDHLKNIPPSSHRWRDLHPTTEVLVA